MNAERTKAFAELVASSGATSRVLLDGVVAVVAGPVPSDEVVRNVLASSGSDLIPGLVNFGQIPFSHETGTLLGKCREQAVTDMQAVRPDHALLTAPTIRLNLEGNPRVCYAIVAEKDTPQFQTFCDTVQDFLTPIKAA